MKSHFYHIQINIDFSKNRQFYDDLMTFLGWQVIFKKDGVVGYRSAVNGDLWFCDSLKKGFSDYDNFGLSHIAIRVDAQKNVDEVVDFLNFKEIKTLFNTPRHRPEFTSSENEIYYQTIFESPDKVQFEIVYIGPKVE